MVLVLRRFRWHTLALSSPRRSFALLAARRVLSHPLLSASKLTPLVVLPSQRSSVRSLPSSRPMSSSGSVVFSFHASPILISFKAGGVTKIIPLGKITEVEQSLVKAAIPELVTSIEKVRGLTVFPLCVTNVCCRVSPSLLRPLSLLKSQDYKCRVLIARNGQNLKTINQIVCILMTE